MTIERLKAYLTEAKGFLGPLVVTGHPAPDGDAVLSALFEAWRLTLSGTPAVPLVQGAMPREVAWLLGDVAPLVPVGSVPKEATLVLTDHNDVAAYQNPVAAVVDHHPVTGDLTGIEAEIDLIGAATTLVAQRLQRDGHTPDKACARMLLGGILLDTDGLSDYKAKVADVDMAAWLYGLCGEDLHALSTTLKEQLLSETDVATLYRRDYRTYVDPAGRPVLGFAILKVWVDACPDGDAVRRLLAEDTAAPTRVAKIVLHYREDNRRRTEIYLAAGAGLDTVLGEVRLAAGPEAYRAAPDAVYLSENCQHWGRKRTAPRLVKILTEKS